MSSTIGTTGLGFDRSWRRSDLTFQRCQSFVSAMPRVVVDDYQPGLGTRYTDVGCRLANPPLFYLYPVRRSIEESVWAGRYLALRYAGKDKQTITCQLKC
jgi:hypothetical protein